MSQEDLDSFVSWLTEKRIPVFASTVSSLTRLTASDETSNAELVRTVLKDASMTAQILRVANSSFYNLTISKTSTVTRAVMLIGFETVRSMCLSVKVIESFLRGTQRDQLLKEMARCFHAAVQARSFAVARHDESPEEIFVASLLCRIGEIAFWSYCPNELCEQLECAYEKPGSRKSAMEMEILGFRLKDLSLRLSQEWSLGELLKSALDGNLGENPRVRYIYYGYEVARALEEGWATSKVNRLHKQLVEFLKRPEEQVIGMIRHNARTAARTVYSYGAESVSQQIPVPVDDEVEHPEESEEGLVEKPLEATDPAMQLDILKEYFGLLADGKRNPKLLITMVLEGIQRGIAMDRVMFAALTPDGDHLRVTHALGWDPPKSLRDFPTIPSDSEYNVFTYIIKTRKAMWLKKNMPEFFSQFIPPELTPLLGEPPFFLAPVMAYDRPVGVVCCDRNVTHRDLDQESFYAFKHFCHQASMGLSLTNPTEN